MSVPICPNCGLPCPITDDDRRALTVGERFCSPIQTPGCWRVEQAYDHDLKAWVMTHEPGEPAPSVAEYRARSDAA